MNRRENTNTGNARTHEIELIISGLTTFALFNLPGWLQQRYADAYVHLSGVLVNASELTLIIVSGLCYSLGICFVAHLISRAYWVGLVGLNAVFPAGIDWSRTPGLGPVTREYYRESLRDLPAAIERADRFSSTLFSVIGLIAMIMLWVGVLMLLAVGLGSAIGNLLDPSVDAVAWTTAIFVLALTGTATLLWFLDAALGRWFPGLQRRPAFRATIIGLSKVVSWTFPQRLILPVQMTLQSNTRPIVFIVLFTLGLFVIVLLGQFSQARFTEFTLSGEFRYLTDGDVAGGMLSSHYEDQRSNRDRLRPYPMIPSVRQDSGFLPLFIPYHPMRDDPLLEEYCAGESRGADCLKRIWRVELNGEPVPLDGFMATERLDLGLRGLSGFVPLPGLEPGLQELSVTWNAASGEESTATADSVPESRRFRIPFVLATDK